MQNIVRKLTKILIALVCLLLLGCTRLETSTEVGKEIEKETKETKENAEFYSVSIDVGPNYVYLKNESCKLYIGIDEAQARSIVDGLKEIKGKRPNTHDLFVDVLSKLNITLKSVKITKMENGVYFAVIEIGNFSVDARPSDAIAIAARTKTTIYVSKDLMHRYGECTITDIKIL